MKWLVAGQVGFEITGSATFMTPCSCGPFNIPACCSDATDAFNVTDIQPQVYEYAEDCSGDISMQEASLAGTHTLTFGPVYQNPDPAWGECPTVSDPEFEQNYKDHNGGSNGCTQEGGTEPLVGFPVEDTTDYAKEFTTDALIAKVRAAFDAWAGTSCSSVRNLPEGEGSYTERQGKWKISIADALPDGMPTGKRLKVQIWTVFTPAEGGASTSTEQWVELNPGETETAEMDIDVPGSNGTNEVMIGEYYCENV